MHIYVCELEYEIIPPHAAMIFTGAGKEHPIAPAVVVLTALWGRHIYFWRDITLHYRRPYTIRDKTYPDQPIESATV
ncbi:hypothetical protein Hanom_Chr01g00004311 [Helianthus anomalus]